MNALIALLTKVGLLKDDLDYHFVRASMVLAEGVPVHHAECDVDAALSNA